MCLCDTSSMHSECAGGLCTAPFVCRQMSASGSEQSLAAQSMNVCKGSRATCAGCPKFHFAFSGVPCRLHSDWAHWNRLRTAHAVFLFPEPISHKAIRILAAVVPGTHPFCERSAMSKTSLLVSLFRSSPSANPPAICSLWEKQSPPALSDPRERCQSRSKTALRRGGASTAWLRPTWACIMPQT